MTYHARLVKPNAGTAGGTRKSCCHIHARIRTRLRTLGQRQAIHITAAEKQLANNSKQSWAKGDVPRVMFWRGAAQIPTPA